MRASLLLSNISLENAELGMWKHVYSGTLTQAQNHIAVTKAFWDKAGSHHPFWSLCRGARVHLHISSNSGTVCCVEGLWDMVQELTNSKEEPKLGREVNNGHDILVWNNVIVVLCLFSHCFLRIFFGIYFNILLVSKHGQCFFPSEERRNYVPVLFV